MGRGQELLDAAREGDRRTVEKIIGQITRRSGPFTSLRRGAGVNVQDDNGYTPLHHACLHGHKEIVRLLLSVDASPCIVDKKGATPLHLAAWKGDTDVVTMLLAHNNPPVVVDHLTSDHESALLIAAQFGYMGVVAQLAAKGADVTLRNFKDESPLDLAAQYGRLETVQYLLRVRPELVDPYRYPLCQYSSTPLHRAAKNGHKDVVTALLAAGFNPNVRCHHGTPLHEAACYGKASVVRILLTNGADLHAKDRRGKTVHDLLADYSEEATRRVRRVIRDYESEDDLPPFPVQDNSPTGYSHYVMKAPDTQKKTNINSSLSPSTSSLTNNQPQSFVKKLACKLGLKHKFNSAPNVNKESGNSTFFQKLSKKDEPGEVSCNEEFQYNSKKQDEFDTISLDRLGTLSRESVVNKSNRSCPGFKTSLPNISENNEAGDSIESIEITEITDDNGNKSDTNLRKAFEANCAKKLSVFEPRDHTPYTTNDSETYLHNECYEPYEPKLDNKESKTNKEVTIPKPPPRPTVVNKDPAKTTYENVVITPKPAARIHIPQKDNEVNDEELYVNISAVQNKRPPTPPKRTFFPSKSTTPPLPSAPSLPSSPSISRSSTLSSDSCVDETNLEDILLSEKSKSFRNAQRTTLHLARRTQSNASDMSDVTQASAIEAVDCSIDPYEEPRYLPMAGTIPRKDPENPVKKKVLFRHKTFTNIELDRNSIDIKDTEEFLKETIPNYHIRGTGHCIYQAPTVQEFLQIFNRDNLCNDPDSFKEVPQDKRDSYFETAICFCKPKPPKHHKSAEDLLDVPYEKEERVNIDFGSLNKRNEVNRSSFQCYCADADCKLHSDKRETLANLVVKFSVIKRSISTPAITLELQNTNEKRGLIKNKSVPHNLEEPYAVSEVSEIIARNKERTEEPSSPIYTTMSYPSTLSSSGPYSIRDISEALCHSNSTDTSSLSSNNTLNASSLQKSTSQHSGHWSLRSCNSNVTVQSDLSFKTCLESSDDGTLLSDDDSSDADTVKNDVIVTTGKRPWVHSDSFKFGNVKEMGSITEESKFESGISVGSVSSSESEGVLGDVLLDASLGDSGGVHSGSARRRWDEAEGTSEGDALSVSSAASSCAPLQLYSNKVSPTPPKKPPRRNLSVSPTHANSPSSGYSYELRAHARSQDDLDEIQSTKSFLKQGRSYSEYEENHSSPRIPLPHPRPSVALRNRPQPVAITTKYENVTIKEQNPRRKLRRNNFGYESTDRMADKARRYQERSSVESLLDDQSMNSPSDCDRYFESLAAQAPLSPTHYEQPPTPEHPPPSAKQAENSIHEKIRPLSQLIMEVVEEIRIRKKSQGDVINNDNKKV